MPINAILYCRFSPRPNAADCLSIETQLDRCRAYCKAHDYQVVAEYQDADASGRNDERPGLIQAVEHTCKLRGSVLVLYSLSRLARRAGNAHNILDRIQDARSDIAFVSDSIDTRTASGRLLYGILATVAQWEAEEIAARTQNAMLWHQANGRRITRQDRCPFGWQPDMDGPMVEKIDKKTGEPIRRPERLVEVPEEQTAIRRIRELRQLGMGSKKIARQLDADGLQCRGHKWHYSTVRAILKRVGAQQDQLKTAIQ